MGNHDGICKVCATPVRKGGKVWSKPAKMAVVGFVLAVSVAFVVLYTQGFISLDFLTSNNDSSISAPVDDMSDNDTGNNKNLANQPNNEDDEYAHTVRDREGRLEMLQHVYEVVLEYIDQSAHIPFVSAGGYLQIWQDWTLITTQYLVNEGFLDDEFLEEEKFIFLLRPMDFAGFDEVDIPSSAEMTLFVGHETVIGIGLYSRYGYQEIFRENLNQILASYTPDFWTETMERPNSTHPLHQQATALISSLMNGADVDIRYMAFNDHFAFATASAVGESHRLRYYLFEVENGNLSLLVHGFENVRHPIRAINQAAPSANLHILPLTHTGAQGLLPPDSPVFSQIIILLHNEGHITDDTQPLFASATEDFAYMVFAGGGVLLVNTPIGWELQNTVGWQQAEERMRQLTENPPFYIIRQE